MFMCWTGRSNLNLTVTSRITNIYFLFFTHHRKTFQSRVRTAGRARSRRVNRSNQFSCNENVVEVPICHQTMTRRARQPTRSNREEWTAYERARDGVGFGVDGASVRHAPCADATVRDVESLTLLTGLAESARSSDDELSDTDAQRES